MRTLVTNDWKLVCAQPPNEERLFDRRPDPHALTNLAGKPEYQGVLSEMLEQLAHELARTEKAP